MVCLSGGVVGLKLGCDGNEQQPEATPYPPCCVAIMVDP